jgi:hypothetical protein
MWDYQEEKWFCPETDKDVVPFSQILVVAGETLSKITDDYFVSGLHKVVHFLLYWASFLGLEVI